MNPTIDPYLSPDELAADEAKTLRTLCLMADRCVTHGVKLARADDPHRFGMLGGQFDDARARRRLVIDYLPAGQRLVRLEFLGTRDGEPTAVSLFTYTVRGPCEGDDPPPSATH